MPMFAPVLARELSGDLVRHDTKLSVVLVDDLPRASLTALQELSGSDIDWSTSCPHPSPEFRVEEGTGDWLAGERLRLLDARVGAAVGGSSV